MPKKLYYTIRQEKYLWHLTMPCTLFLLDSKIAIDSLVFEILVLENFLKRLNIHSFSLILLFLFPSNIAKSSILLWSCRFFYLFNQFWWSSVGIRIFPLVIIPIFLTLQEVIRAWGFDRIFFGNQARKVTQTWL